MDPGEGEIEDPPIEAPKIHLWRLLRLPLNHPPRGPQKNGRQRKFLHPRTTRAISKASKLFATLPAAVAIVQALVIVRCGIDFLRFEFVSLRLKLVA